MRYLLIPSQGCPAALCDQLNAALQTPRSRSVYHAAKGSYSVRRDHDLESFIDYLKTTHRLPRAGDEDELRALIERSGMGFHEAMMLPVKFDMSAKK